MSADRLRAAADRLDSYADDFHSREYEHRADQDRATAALLRAQADYHSDGTCLCTPEWTDYMGRRVSAMTDYPCAAALALADAVLGTPNSDPVRTDDEQ